MGSDIHDVARKANVSISTVSRVLNSSGYASKATRIKVMAAIEELGYKQNSIAKSLRQQNSSFIGLIIPDVANEFFATLASIIERSIHYYGFSLFLCNTMENKNVENQYIESLLANQVRGIILVSTSGLDTNLTGDTPIVFVDRFEPDIQTQNRVFITSDNENGGRIAAQELLRRGVRRFVFIGDLRDERNFNAMRKREKGFSETLFANGVSRSDYLEEIIPELPVSAARARETIRNVYAKFPFDGVFCGTDVMAIGSMRGLIDMGLDVPNDVQLIGFDGIQLGEFTIPAISTIKQDINTIGKIASQKIISMINGDQHGETIVLPVNFLERGTTKNPVN